MAWQKLEAMEMDLNSLWSEVNPPEKRAEYKTARELLQNAIRRV